MTKKDAEYYVKVYCDYLHVAGINDEIAQMAPHMLGRLVDHLGEIPPGSGFFHDVLSIRVDRMRRLHRDFNRAKQLLIRLPDQQYKAVLMWSYLIGTQPATSEKRLTTGKDIAAHLGVVYDSFRKNRQRGLDAINAELGFILA